MGEAVLLACRGGKALIEGIPEDTVVPLPVQQARRRELEVIFGNRTRNKDHDAMRLIEDGSFAASRYVTHTFPIEKTQEAYELASDYGDSCLKVVINP